MVNKLSAFLVLFLLVAVASGNDVENLRMLIWSTERDQLMEPNVFLDVLVKYQKNFPPDEPDAERSLISKLVWLNDPKFCENESLYSDELNKQMIKLLKYPNLSNYVNEKFKEKLKDGCREGVLEPQFIREYDDKLEDSQKRLEQERKLSELWSKFSDDSDIEPLETFKLLQNLRKVELKKRSLTLLDRLVSVKNFAYRDCRNSKIVFEEFIPSSWLNIPKVVKYIDHYQQRRREECDWYLLSNEDRKLSTVPVEVDCDQLLKSKEMGIKRSYSLAFAIQHDPSRCDEKTRKLADYAVLLSTCLGVECCTVPELAYQNRETLFSTDSSYDISKLVTQLGSHDKHVCSTWLDHIVSPVATDLEFKLENLRSVYNRASHRSIEDIVKSVLPVQKSLGITVTSKSKLKVLDNHITEPCNLITSSLPPEAIAVLQSDLRYNDIWFRLPDNVEILRSLMRWCINKNPELEAYRKKLILKSSRLLPR